MQWRGREIETQFFPDADFRTWPELVAFVPKGAFYALFMPLPGLYPMNGKVGRILAAAENALLLALAVLAVLGLRRVRWTPAAVALLATFLALAAGAGLLEYDLGSAARHKLLTLSLLLPFAARALPFVDRLDEGLS